MLQESDCSDVNKHDTVTSVVVRPPENTNLTENAISEISIVQQYQFSSSLQRMSVIACALGSNNFRVYTKGSPEMIIDLSKPETVPRDISHVLERYTRQGHRVIAMGRRTIISENSAEVILNFSSCIISSCIKIRYNEKINDDNIFENYVPRCQSYLGKRLNRAWSSSD